MTFIAGKQEPQIFHEGDTIRCVEDIYVKSDLYVEGGCYTKGHEFTILKVPDADHCRYVLKDKNSDNTFTKIFVWDFEKV